MPYTVDVHSGDVWMSGTNAQTVNPTERLKITVHNSSEATNHAVMLLFAAGAETTFFLESWIDPTSNLPTTEMGVNNAIWDGRAYNGNVTVKADVSNLPFGGGVQSNGGITVGPNGVVIPFELHIPPGHTLGLQTKPQPGSNEVSVSFSFVDL